VTSAITGGSGVVGSALVRHLVTAGDEVTALAHSDRSVSILEALGARPVRGDVLDRESVRRLVSGSDQVFHVAGVNEMCSPHPEVMDQVNIEGTRIVLEESMRAGARRLIHTSSAATIGEESGTVGSESSPHRGSYQSRYERSKHLAELMLLEQCGEFPVVLVNPASVQGPGRSTGTAKLFLDLLNGRLPFLVETSVAVVDIDDTARGHILAAERGSGGERYLLCGANFKMSDALNMLARAGGREMHPRFLPGGLVEALAAVGEGAARLVGRRPKFCREMIRVLRAGHVYDGTKATRDLGLAYTPIEETIRRTIEWFEVSGLLN
jgi:dihydroflavonol-4-reductase